MSPPAAGDDAEALPMLRSEQRLRVGSEWVAVEQVLIRRRIVTETVQLSVTVRREELVFAKSLVPQTVADSPLGFVRPFTTVLREEVPVISLVTRPYEQVAVSVVQVVGESTIATALASEQVELSQSDKP